jgi:hypothetical protein
MSKQPRRSRHRTRAMRRFGWRRVVGALLVFAFAASGVAAANPGLLVLAGALLLPTALRAAHIRVRRRCLAKRHRLDPWPTNPPIEEIAADLRRLLWQHDAVMRSDKVVGSARRLWSLEAAITRRATQAARALDVPHPSPPEHRGLGRSELHVLLNALAAEGLVLPATVGLMVPDNQR